MVIMIFVFKFGSGAYSSQSSDTVAYLQVYICYNFYLLSKGASHNAPSPLRHAAPMLLAVELLVMWSIYFLWIWA